MTKSLSQETFRRVVLARAGIQHLAFETVPKPRPSADEILVRIQAVALNYVDLAIVEGNLGTRGTLPFIPVADGAGMVEAVGSAVSDFQLGDRVCTLYLAAWSGGRYGSALTGLEIRPGAGTVSGQLSEYKLFRRDQIIRVPPHLSASEAATLPIAGVTAWNALAYGRLKPGRNVLIHGTGGVAIFALQFAKLFGARVIIISGSEAKLERAKSLGADVVINGKHSPTYAEAALRVTHNEGVDLVVETVGGSNLQESLRALRPEGHISVVGFLGGTKAELDLIALNLKRATLTGVSVGSRQDCEDMLAAIAQHRMKPLIGATFPFSRAKEAFSLLKAGIHFGKIVIELNDAPPHYRQ